MGVLLVCVLFCRGHFIFVLPVLLLSFCLRSFLFSFCTAFPFCLLESFYMCVWHLCKAGSFADVSYLCDRFVS